MRSDTGWSAEFAGKRFGYDHQDHGCSARIYDGGREISGVGAVRLLNAQAEVLDRLPKDAEAALASSGGS